MKFNGKTTIKAFEWLADDVFKLSIHKPETMGDIKAGQFFNIMCTSVGYPMLRRPISVSGFGDDCFEVTVKILGTGTAELSKLKPGDVIDLMGPLGNGFHIGNHGKVLVVGGGIGVAPLKGLIQNALSDDVAVDVILGFRDAPYMIDAFERRAEDLQIVSENDVKYPLGYVTGPFRQRLEKSEYDMVYSCGPHKMLESIAKIANEKGVPTQLLMEEKMACGIGACLVCTCKIKDGDFGFTQSRMCKDGPMFYASEVIFDAE